MASHDPEHLLAQARWVRALARELAGRAGEDVAQEAFVAALAQPTAGRNVAAWLAGVVRNLARRSRREEASRARRELVAARPEALPASDELVAEGELQRRLAAAVMELEEPYRATVLLHYFRELPLVAIARQQGVPAATVRTRLRRALAQLRAELDRGAGGRDAWALVALGGGTPGGLAAASAGGIGMGMKLKLAAASAAAVLGWLAWRELTPAVEPELAHASPATVGDEPAPAATQGSPPGPALVESGSVEPRTHVPEPPRFAEVLVHGSAFDSQGAPVEAWVTLEDEWANVLRTENPAQGSWAISGVHPGVWALSAAADGFVRKRLQVELSPHDDRHELSLVFEAATSSRVVVLDEHGARLSPEDGVYAFASLERPVAGANLSSEHFTAARLATWSRVPEQREVPSGCVALLHWQEPFPLYVHLATGGRLLESRLVSAPTEEFVFEVDRALLAHRTATIRARFVDGITKLPVQGAAHLSTGREHRIGGTPLDTEGRVAFEKLPPAVRFLNCDAPGYARCTHQVTVREGEALDLGDLELWPRSTLRARLHDEEGLAVSGLLQWMPVAGSTVWDLAGPRHSRGGSFELREVPRTLVWLRIQSEGRATRCLAVDPSETEARPLEISMPKGQRVVIRRRPADVGRHVAIATAEGGPIGSWILGDWPVCLSLVEGEYELRVRGSRGEKRTPFVVGSEPLEVQVPPPGE